MGENTTIELKPGECALILDEDWEAQVYIPGMDDDDDAPLNTKYITMLAILTKNDDGFIEEILDRFHNIIDDTMEKKEEYKEN